MKGYLNNQEATAGCLGEDGWLRSGDLGYYDEEGNVFVVDRMKELIKYNAFQVRKKYCNSSVYVFNGLRKKRRSLGPP